MLPGFIGVFIDALSKEVKEIYLLLHEGQNADDNNADYRLTGSNIIWINLGRKSPAWHRAICHKRLLKEKVKKIDFCDALIVRAPSPLAPYFNQYLNQTKLFYFIVGDYGAEAADAKPNSLREWLMWKYIAYNDRLFMKAITGANILVNSAALKTKYLDIAKTIEEVRTTTLSASDFYKRENTCNNSVINILYTGRIDPMKGLFELMQAMPAVVNKNKNVKLNIVGWEVNAQKPVELALMSMASKLGIANKIIFHGKKTIGRELNEMYKMADVYILPSHHEGFPRTIWEAMANSLPVIASSVGSIPEFLSHGKDVLIIKPKSIPDIEAAITKLIENDNLRSTLITNGYQLASMNTLEIQSKKMIGILKKIVND